MSTTFLSMREVNELSKMDSPSSEIHVTTFCGPPDVLVTQKNRVCLQISVHEYSSSSSALILLTRRQALDLAKSILSEYEQYEGGNE